MQPLSGRRFKAVLDVVLHGDQFYNNRQDLCTQQLWIACAPCAGLRGTCTHLDPGAVYKIPPEAVCILPLQLVVDLLRRRSTAQALLTIPCHSWQIQTHHGLVQ